MNTPKSPPPVQRRTPSRRQILGGGAALALTSLTGPWSGVAYAQPGDAVPAAPFGPPVPPRRGTNRRRAHQWAQDTWRCLVAMTNEQTGLASDNIGGNLAASSRSGYTSPTNIGGYLWSAVVARELGIITPGNCHRRLKQTLATLLRMEHHRPSGMFYNWYDEASGEVLTTWPEDGKRVYPFLSSVDNGWLGAALMVVRNADPGTRQLSDRLFSRMRWDMFYDAKASRPGGLIHGGFYDAPPPPGSSVFTGNHIGVGPDVWYTNHHYDTAVSETRITSYIGISQGQIPPQQYFATWRTFPETCDWSWPESKPVGTHRTYLGIDVFEGAYLYRGMRIVPGWGGSMFEELMPDVFVPEARWGRRSWGVNHPLFVRAQRQHGLHEAGYGYWGFSPSNDPFGGYREYGVDALGMNPDGYFSDEEKTNYDAGFGDCRPATNPNPRYGDGVVTPHASFLAMMHEPRQAFVNLVRIQDRLHAYGPGGFYDAVAVRSGTIAKRYLSLDQSMIMGALGNVLAGQVVRANFATAPVERVLRPLLAMEQFGARPAA